jgi:hypothetical protein
MHSISTRCDGPSQSASYLWERQKVIEDAECVLTSERNTQHSRECPEVAHGGSAMYQRVELFVTWSCGALVILVGAICHFRLTLGLAQSDDYITMSPNHYRPDEVTMDTVTRRYTLTYFCVCCYSLSIDRRSPTVRSFSIHL